MRLSEHILFTERLPAYLCYNHRMKHKNHLVEHIAKNDFNQTSFARYLGIPRKTLVEYCTGRNLPLSPMARKIAEELGADLLAIWPEYHLSQNRGFKKKSQIE